MEQFHILTQSNKNADGASVQLSVWKMVRSCTLALTAFPTRQEAVRLTTIFEEIRNRHAVCTVKG
jgi:hypothetical protein